MNDELYKIENLFDWQYYLEINKDLTDAGIHDKISAYEHFINYGKYENRPHRFFDKTIKLVLMTKNENYLIRHWIEYHGDIFGYNNLYIIDDSDDPIILRYYDSIKQLGINLIFLKSNLQCLENDINNVFNQLKTTCDFLIKLDTDEFIGYYDVIKDEISINKETIHKEINNLPINGLKYKVSYTINVIPNKYYDDPLLNINFTKPFKTTFKTFFLAKTYLWCDLGSHNGQVLPQFDSSNHNDTNLIIIHYHKQKFEQTIENAKKVIASHNYINYNDSREQMIEKLTPLFGKSMNSCHKISYYYEYLTNPLCKENYYNEFSKYQEYYQFDGLYKLYIKKCIIITTINEPTKAINEFIKTGYDVIIVGDYKTPNTYKNINVIFLDVEKQRNLFPTICDLIPYNHYCRKNIGYLYAIKNNYDIIAESDDDNIPYGNWTFFRNIKSTDIKTITSPEFPNIYKCFTTNNIYPRGFPLDEVNNNTDIVLVDNFKDIKVIQTTVDNEPDIDAITRLTKQNYITTFDKNKYYTFDKNVWTQINTQNTIFLSKEVFYLLYLPCTLSFRTCDIIKGYILQKVLGEKDYSVLYCSSTVYQDRNEHNLLKDFKDEILLYIDIKNIINILKNIRISGSIDDLKIIYNTLFTEGYIKSEELIILDEFIKIYKNI